MQKSTKLNTPKFRVSYPAVFEPKMNTLSKQNEYSLVALFPKDADMNGMKEAVLTAITEKWGPDKAKWPKNLRTPFRDQADREKTDEATGKKTMPPGHEKGAVYINLKSKNKPRVVNQQVQDIIEPTEFYAGCWAIASVNAFAYSNAGNNGVSFGLNNIQKVADGDPFGGRTRPEDDFVAVTSDESGSAPASTADLFQM